MAKFFVGADGKFVTLNGRLVSDKKWAVPFTEKVAEKTAEKFGLKLIKTTIKSKKKFGLMDIPAELFCDGKKVHRHRSEPIKLTTNSIAETDGKRERFDEDILFKKLNETCLKCSHSCKQSYLATIIRCGDMDIK